jgi:hypothetical protein
LPWPVVRVSGCGQQGERRAVLGGDRPASGARSKTRQRTGNRSGLPWPGQGVGLLPWSGQCWRCSMAIGRQAVLGQRRDNALAADRACRAWSGCRVAGRGAQLPAVRPGLRSLDCCGQQGERRAVLGGDRPASGARSNARQRTGSQSGLPWSGQDLGLRAARRASCSAWWRSPASGARSKTRQRTGGRSGLPWPGQGLGLRAGSGCRWRGQLVQCSVTIAGKRCQAEDEAAHWRPIGLAVAWSGCRVAGRGAQSPAVHPGLRSLDW